MAGRSLNPRLAKIHRCYSVEEVGRLFGIHKNTVRNWLKRGLVPIDTSRPTLIHGATLRKFLDDRRQDAKRPCPPGHLYCMRCRSPKLPAGAMADYLPKTLTSGNLRGLCPDCETLMHQRTTLVQLERIRPILEISIPLAQRHIGEGSDPSVNCDSEQVEQEHASE